jgi:predicted transcriptional regulator of viral defense system
MTRAVYDPLPSLLRRAVRVVALQEAATEAPPANPETPDLREAMPAHQAYATLVRRGLLHRIAAGYYALVPGDEVGQSWKPVLEAAAWGIAAADDGPRSVSLMGLSAAKEYGALDETLSTAVIATTRNRPAIRFTDRQATVSFIRRDPNRMRIKRHTTQLGQGWITTVEQTMLDLAQYPQLGGRPDLANAAISGLVDQADPHVLNSLAIAHRRQGALDRILEMI